MGHPTMQVSHELTKLDVGLDVLDVQVSPVDAGHVVEHEEDAGHGEAEEHEEREATEAVGMGNLDVCPVDTRRMEVEKDVRRNDEHLVSRGVGITGTKDRLPNLVMEELVVDRIRDRGTGGVFNGHSSDPILLALPPMPEGDHDPEAGDDGYANEHQLERFSEVVRQVSPFHASPPRLHAR